MPWSGGALMREGRANYYPELYVYTLIIFYFSLLHGLNSLEIARPDPGDVI